MTHSQDFEILTKVDFEVAWRICKRHYLLNTGLTKQEVKDQQPGEVHTRLLSLYYSGFLTAVDKRELGLTAPTKEIIVSV